MRPLHVRLPFLLAASALLFVSAPLRAQDAATVAMTVQRLPDGLRFGLIGARPAQPAPTLFVLQGDLDDCRRIPIYTEVARLMEKHGFLSVVLDAPAHGEDHRPDEPMDLAAWCTRVDHGEDIAAEFTAHARAVLDYLVKEGYTDPKRVAAVGTSRGGYLAFQFAAAEPRIRFVGGISPLTDLLAIREFKATTNRPLAEELNLIHLAPRLAGRPAWVVIGNNDARVGTDQVIAFTRALVQAGAAVQPPDTLVGVKLIVKPSIGHRSASEDHEQLAAWLLAQFAAQPANAAQPLP